MKLQVLAASSANPSSRKTNMKKSPPTMKSVTAIQLKP